MMFNFGRKVRRVARRQRRHGKIDRDTYQKIVAGSRDPDTVVRWKAAIESRVPGAPWTIKTGADWRNKLAEIWQWFLENWPAILKLLLTLMVFVEPLPQSESEESD
jgi:hypothetical protein